MRTPRILLTAILGLFGLVAVDSTAQADSPLRFVPPGADVLVEVPRLRGAADALLTLDAIEKAQTFPPVKELLASTSYRRFYQLVAYLETELGAKWPELLDRLAGNGVVLAANYGADPTPFLAVLEGTDEKTSTRAFDTALAVLEAELARQESKQTITRVSVPGQHVTVSIGENFFLARRGAVVLASNKKASLEKALELVEKGGKSMADDPGVAEARSLVPADSLARIWLNMEAARRLPQLADLYKTPREPPLTVLFGSYVDILSRTPYVTAGLVREGDNLSLRIRMPRGREGMGADAGLHLPPGDQPGSRPLLEPNGVMFSYSFFLDLSHVWTDRVALFGPMAGKAMEEADKNSGKIPLNGIRLSKILTEAGTYHRVVVANQARLGYERKPRQVQPAFAVVTEMRDPESFSRSAEIGLRGFAFTQTNTWKLKMVEEKYKDVAIVAYRFAEDKHLPEDEADARYNYSPCFCRVGKQFVVSSTQDLCRELIDLLQAEASRPDASSPAIARQCLYADGAARVLEHFEDQIMLQAILDQAVPPAEARAQAKGFIDYVRGLGRLQITSRIDSRQLSYDISLGKTRALPK